MNPQQQQNFPVQPVSHPTGGGTSATSIGSSSSGANVTHAMGTLTGTGVCRLCPSSLHGSGKSAAEKTDAERANCAADTVAIGQVMARYYYFFDTQNVEGWLSLWARDGEFRTNRSRGAFPSARCSLFDGVERGVLMSPSESEG